MLKYLIILLDNTSTSYCHYENKRSERKLISIEDLKAGILFAMKENLVIQFVYPDYELPQDYKDAIYNIDHCKIVPGACNEDGDVVVINDWEDLKEFSFSKGSAYVLRTNMKGLLCNQNRIKDILDSVARLNIVITDIDTFSDEDIERYKECLSFLSENIEQLYVSGASPQLNILTDRMQLDSMNNCNAGWENITLAPDGKFYVCPAFYLADDEEDFGLGKAKFNIGDLQNGLDIKNPQLYKLSHSPLCRNCDAYQCKRCVWLNRKTTLEVNTPSHEQCVLSHIERNASKSLLERIRQHGDFLPDINIPTIDYLDPFEKRNEWN